MSIIKGNGSGDASVTSGFYLENTPNQSLRFDGSQSPYLHRPAGNITASDRRVFTFSCWIKRSSIKRTQFNSSTGNNQVENTPLFQAWTNANLYTLFRIDGTSDVLTYYDWDGSTDYGKDYFVPIRDLSNWYHVVYAIDTTHATASNRVKVYLNGNLLDDTDIMNNQGTFPLNHETHVNSGNNHSIGYYLNNTAVTDHFDGYMSDIHFIDGLQMKPEAFGQSKNGLWIPKLYSTSSNKLTKLAQNEGTVIGDFDQNGQNAAAFNGTKVQTITNSAVKNSSTSAFIGKSWGTGTPRKIHGFKITAPTTLGFVGSGATTFTVKLYGSTNTFYNQSTIDNGSLIFFSGNITDSNTRGTLSFFYNSSVESEDVYGSWDLANMNSPVYGGYKHNWVVITPNNSESVHISQVEFFDSKNVTNDYYGSNGFRLDFRNKSYIGYDYQTSDRSGTTNDFTANVLDQYDPLPDIPRNNFATLNPLAKEGPSTNDNIIIGQGGLRVDQTAGTSAYAGGTATMSFPTTGKWYVEGYINAHAPATNDIFAFGLKSISVHGAMLTVPSDYTKGAFYLTFQDSNDFIGINNATPQANLNGTKMTYSATHKIALAFDADSGKFWFGRDNGTGGLLWWNNNGNQDGNPSAGTGQTGVLTSDHEYIFSYMIYRTTGNYGVTFNFGQDSSFAGVITSGSASAQDANGNGDFYHTPPTSFLALCSNNLGEPDLSANKAEKPNDYFETVLYTGTGTGITRTNHNFDLDWAWIKNRSDASTDHIFYDTSRGKFIPSSAYNTSGDGNVVDNDRIDGDRALFPKDIVFPTTANLPPQEAESGAITEIMNNGLAFGNTTGSTQTVTFPVESVEIGGERVFHPVVPLGMTITVNSNQYTEGTRLPTTSSNNDRATLVGWNSTSKVYDNVVGLTYRPHNDDNIPDYGLGTGVLSNSNGLTIIATGVAYDVFHHVYNTDSNYEYFIAIQQGTGNTTDSDAQDMGSYRIKRYFRGIGQGGGGNLTPTTITAKGTATNSGFTQDNGIITSITIKNVNVTTSGLSTYDHTNKNNSKYVAWCWKANGYNPTDTITYTVKVASIGGNNRYIFNDLQEANVNLQLQKGRSYIFDVTDNSLIGHPFYVLDELPQSLSSPSQQTYDFNNHTSDSVRPEFYVNGSQVFSFNDWHDRFNSNNRSDLTSLQIRLTVPDDFRDTAYLGYGCYLHSNMGGVIYQNHARGSSNFDGNTPSVVNYSSKAKFSIVTWTVGSSPSTQTIGHGLELKPDMVIYKERTGVVAPLYVWHKYNTVYNSGDPNGNYLQLESNVVSQGVANWENVTDTTFKGNLNAATGETFVAYCFASVDGFSRFGGYTGSGKSNFIYLGFTPSFVMVKATTNNSNWQIKDSKRNESAYSTSRIFNPVSENLAPNLRSAHTDDTDIDFLSNGFRIDVGASNNLQYNTSNIKYIYMAFAENPFKYTNGK